MPATRIDLGDLHDLLAKSLREQINAYKASGEPMPASFVKEVREFLKDNDIEAIATVNPDLKAINRDVNYGFDEDEASG